MLRVKEIKVGGSIVVGFWRETKVGLRENEGGIFAGKFNGIEKVGVGERG